MVFGKSPEECKRDLRSGEVAVSVYGLGRVGLPLAVSWLMAGAQVIGVDKDEAVVRRVLSMESGLDEPGVDEALAEYVPSGQLTATTDGVKASRDSVVKLVAVPTKVNMDTKAVDLSALEDVYRRMGSGLKKGDLVITESSVPPGTTSGVAKPVLEDEAGLGAGEDFGLAYSPERIYEGRVIKDIVENYPKIVGADDRLSLDAAASLYECVASKGVIRVGSSVTAEAEKLFEGIYRDLNIALANELAKFCDAIGVDYVEARAAANSQPYCHLHYPGAGVGGWCLPFYPYFVLRKAEAVGVRMPLIRLARDTNEEMPSYVVELAASAAARTGMSIGGSKVAVLGLSFRGDVADTRQSPSYEIIERLHSLGAEVWAYDPHLSSPDRLLQEKGGRWAATLDQVLENASVVVVTTEHTAFRDISLLRLFEGCKQPHLLVVDGRNVLDISTAPEGVTYVGLGRRTVAEE